jgi:hypothetical protein
MQTAAVKRLAVSALAAVSLSVAGLGAVSPAAHAGLEPGGVQGTTTGTATTNTGTGTRVSGNRAPTTGTNQAPANPQVVCQSSSPGYGGGTIWHPVYDARCY